MKKVYHLILLFFFGLFIPNQICGQTGAITVVHESRIDEGLNIPMRVAVDESNDFYVTDVRKNKILRYSNTGELAEEIDYGGKPISVAVNSNGLLIIGDKENGNILVRDKTGLISEISRDPVLPAAIAIDDDDLIYVVDTRLEKVFVFDLQGNLKRTIGENQLVVPSGIAFNPLTQEIIVTEHGGYQGTFSPPVGLHFFDLDGNFIKKVGSHGNGDGKFYRIQGVDVDKCGNIYVADNLLNRISVFDKDGIFISHFGEFGNDPGQLNMPVDIALNSKGQILITCMNTGAIEIFNLSGVYPNASFETTKSNICPDETTEIKIEFSGIAPWSFSYSEPSGEIKNVLYTTENPYKINTDNEGTYKLIKFSDNNCSFDNYEKSLAIKKHQPKEPDLPAEINKCEGETVLLNPGSGFASYLWNNSIRTQTIEVNQTSKNHLLTTDTNGCEAEANVQVNIMPFPIADFDFEMEIGKILFTNTSQNATTYFWDFDDGHTSTELSPTHNYIKTGVYDVSLTAKNEACPENFIRRFIPVGTSSISENLIEKIQIYPNPTNGLITIANNGLAVKHINIEVIDFSGKSIRNCFLSELENNTIDISSFSNGIYTINISYENTVLTKKVVLLK